MHLDIARKVFCFDLQCRVDVLGYGHSVFLGNARVNTDELMVIPESALWAFQGAF